MLRAAGLHPFRRRTLRRRFTILAPGQHNRLPGSSRVSGLVRAPAERGTCGHGRTAFGDQPVGDSFQDRPSVVSQHAGTALFCRTRTPPVSPCPALNSSASIRAGADAVTPTTRRTRRSVFRLEESLASGTPLHPRRATARRPSRRS